MASPTGSILQTLRVKCTGVRCHATTSNVTAQGAASSGCNSLAKKKLFQRLSSSVQIWLLLLTNLWRLL